VFADFNIGGSGAVRATMDWTFATNQMFLYIMAGITCTDQDFVTFLTTGARVFVVNLGPTGESGVVTITLTR
jgi:hypothetical protein